MDEAPGGWIALLISGIATTLYAVVYTIWTLIPLLFGGLTSIRLAIEGVGNGDFSQIIGSIIVIIAPVVQVVVYPIIGILGILMLVAAFRFKSYQSKGIVWLGILSSVGAPLLGLGVTSMSLCNFGSGGCCIFGFLLGNVGTLPVLIIGLICAIAAFMSLSNPLVAEGFEANA